MNFSQVRKMIFKDENGKYSLSVGKKQEDGTFKNKSMKVVFNKDVVLNDKETIDIKQSKLEFYDWEYQGQKGTTWFIRVFAFDRVDERQPVEKLEDKINDDPFKAFGKIVEVEENEELPF